MPPSSCTWTRRWTSPSLKSSNRCFPPPPANTPGPSDRRGRLHRLVPQMQRSPLPASRGEGKRLSKRHDDAVERRVAIEQVYALRGDQNEAVALDQAMECGTGEQPLRLTTVLDHE